MFVPPADGHLVLVSLFSGRRLKTLGTPKAEPTGGDGDGGVEHHGCRRWGLREAQATYTRRGVSIPSPAGAGFGVLVKSRPTPEGHKPLVARCPNSVTRLLQCCLRKSLPCQRSPTQPLTCQAGCCRHVVLSRCTAIKDKWGLKHAGGCNPQQMCNI